MKEIKEDVELMRFDGITEVSVYTGNFDCLKPAALNWRITEDQETLEYMGRVEVLKLSEIVEQLNECGMITIFIDSPLHGEVWQYGNYGDSWWEIGELAGYA